MRNFTNALFKKHNQGDKTGSNEKSGVNSWNGRGKKLVHRFSNRTWMEEIFGGVDVGGWVILKLCDYLYRVIK